MKSRVIKDETTVVHVGNYGGTGEKLVKIDSEGRGLVGILNKPGGIAAPAVVLMLHGFTGQKNEFQLAKKDIGLFACAAAKLAEHGIATLRIDFNGSGDSAGNWVDTTFSGQINDAMLAYDYLQTLRDVDGSRVGILGYSQGGLVASHLAALRPQASAVVLWAPVTNPMATFSNLLGADTVARAIAGEASEEIRAKLSWGGETTLKAAFYKELPLFAPALAISRYHGPLRVVVGTNEAIVAPQPAEGRSLLSHHDGVNDLVEVDSGHDWNGETSPDIAENVLIPSTVEWFGRFLNV